MYKPDAITKCGRMIEFKTYGTRGHGKSRRLLDDSNKRLLLLDFSEIEKRIFEAAKIKAWGPRYYGVDYNQHVKAKRHAEIVRYGLNFHKPS
jgi:hypothetical protein